TKSQQPALGTEGVKVRAGDTGRGSRAFVESKTIDVAGRRGEAPFLFPISCVQTLDDFFIAHAMKQHSFAAQSDGAAQPGARLVFPELGRTILRPFAYETRFRRSTVAFRPQKLGPVGGLC